MAPNYPEPGHIEQGYADVLAHDSAVHPEAATPPPIPSWLLKWEDNRPRWIMELVAEFVGVFIYVYGGVGATASFIFSSVAKQAGFGDLLTIGIAYGLSIAFAIIVSAPTSGGHLSPGYTIAFAIFKGFPWRKVPLYIIAQILGAFVAALFIYGQYHQQFTAYHDELIALGPIGKAQIFTPSGPAGVMAIYPAPGQHLGYVFFNELMANTFLALLVWAVLDPSNFFISFTTAPLLIGAAYMVIIWGFAFDTVTLNTARDLGPRIVAAIIWGKGAFPSKYSALAALTNILGTSLGALLQTLFLSDTNRPLVNHPPPVTKHGKALDETRSIRRMTFTSQDAANLSKRATFASIPPAEAANGTHDASSNEK